MNVIEFPAGRSTSVSLDHDPGESVSSGELGQLEVELGLGELFAIFSRLVPACRNDVILSGSARKRSSKRLRRIFSYAEFILIS